MMGNAAYSPLEVGPNEDGTQLRIRWKDGHVSDFPPRLLRIACACAGCVDEMTGRKILKEEDVPADVYPLTVEYVGRYALRFDWSDGHGTGIYPFEYLRKLSPE
jgi:ATP-binding protein involved in chromosome partitioning